MTKQEKLITLLQPKDYKSKIHLFCAEKRIEQQITLEKLVYVNRKDYIRKVIKIQDI